MEIRIDDPARLQDIQDIWTRSLQDAGIARRSSDGLYDLRIEEVITEGGTTYSLRFKEWGLYLDAGVMGAKGGRATSSPFRMKSKGIFRALSGKLDPQAIGAIYWYGLRPRPFLDEFKAKITQEMVADIQREIVQDINTQIQSTPKTEIKSKL